MSERLPGGYFEKLSASMWQLARVSMHDLILVAPVPSTIKGETHHGNLCLEPQIELTYSMPDALKKVPRKISLYISEKEPYELDESLILYSFKKLSLDRSKKSRSYETGIMIFSDTGSSIIPHLDQPAVGRSKRSGNKEWRGVLEGNVATFGIQEADYFLETTDMVTSKLCEEEIENWNP